METRGVSSDTPTTDAAVGAGTAHADWQNAAIVEIVDRTPSIKSFFLRLSAPFGYVAGQHVDVRLTAPDGYVAMRSYSIASSPAPSEAATIELAIERLPDGEVSPFFHDVATIGDDIELRGPLGGHFIWPGSIDRPVLLIGAGSGVVPLMSMIRYRSASAQSVPTALLLSSRTRRDVLFGDELFAAEQSGSGFAFALTLTREAPARPSDFSRRIDSAMVAEVASRLPGAPGYVFICGSNAFVDTAADGAITAGLASTSIKTERYGA
jgi:ferredoxin-NADP reductase